jgi:hypothetical protein
LFKLIKAGVGPSLLASSLEFISVGVKGTDLRACFEALIKGPENREEVRQAVECLKIGVKITELRSALSCLNKGVEMSELMLALSCISFGIKEEQLKNALRCLTIGIRFSELDAALICLNAGVQADDILSHLNAEFGNQLLEIFEAGVKVTSVNFSLLRLFVAAGVNIKQDNLHFKLVSGQVNVRQLSRE